METGVAPDEAKLRSGGYWRINAPSGELIRRRIKSGATNDNDLALGDPMEVDLPDVVKEVSAAFERYEQALVGNQVEALDAMFRDDPRTIRYGAGENLYGHAEIATFRAGRSPQGLARDLSRTVITTYGREFATASTLFYRAANPAKVGRQMQSWVKFGDEWKVVAAHVSLIDEARVVDRDDCGLDQS